ncbi:hypothetical protein KCU76_g18220, partial [Aureobasidium melanogenum]
MEGLSAKLQERLRVEGTQAVIQYLEGILQSHGEAESRLIKYHVEIFIESEQHKLEDCAFQIEELLKRHKISINDTTSIFKETSAAGRKRRDLKRIEEHWDRELIDHYQWDKESGRFLAALAKIASQLTVWRTDAAPLFSRLIFNDLTLGNWGKIGNCPERPIKTGHVNKLREYVDPDSVKDNKKAVSNSPAPPLIPLHEDEVRRNNLKLDTYNLLIANSGLDSDKPTNRQSSKSCAETVVPPNHDSTTSPTKSVWQINDGERPAADLITDTDDCSRSSSCVPATTPPAMETVDMDSVAALDTSPSITDSEGGVKFTPFEEQRTGFEPESRENDKPASQSRDSWYPKEGEKGMQDAVVAEDRDRQADLLAKIAEALCLTNSRHGPTTEEMCSSLFAEHIARAIEIKQEDILSAFYNHLSNQQVEVGRKLELAIARTRQELSDVSLSDQKEIVEAIESRTQRDLKISYDATIKRLDRVEEQMRDRFARAGLGIVDELKSVQKMGMEVTNKLSRKWRENSAQMAQSQIQNVDKLRSDILGKFSRMQKHAMKLEQEVRDLRRAFESRKDGSPETQSKDILPNVLDEAESQMQADIKEGISQMQQTLIRHTQMQQTLIEHMQMQLGMNEKTQAFQDQQVINLTGVKSQLDAMVSRLPISEEVVASQKQAAQYFHEIGEKLGKLQDDPEITEIPLDLQDS